MQAFFGALFPQANPQPQPSRSPLEIPPQGPSPLPHLPLPILQRILYLGSLPSADILALAATCRTLMQHCTPLAYHSLHFPLDASTGTPRGTRALLRTLQLLMQTIYIHSGRGRPAHILRITLFAARTRRRGATPPEADDDAIDADDPFALPGADAHALRDADAILAQLVALAPHLRTFVLDASAAGQALAFPATLAVLAHDRPRALAELALVRVSAGSPWARSAWPEGVAGSLCARRMTVRSEDVRVVRAFLGAPVGLRELDFRESVVTLKPWLTLFDGGFHEGGYAHGVERFILTCGGRSAAFEDHSEVVLLALSRPWASLTTLSISAFAQLERVIPPLATHACPLRRLRVTVNVDDQFIPEFDPACSPHLVRILLRCFPDLEELVFDHMGATLFAYALHEECLIEWAMAIRNSRCLRVLALSSLFVLDPKECRSDSADDGSVADVGSVISDVEMDAEMDVEMGGGFGPGLLISEVEAGNAADLRSIDAFVDDLALFAERFFNEHLRSECLHELRFLYNDPESGIPDSIGFRPRKLEGSEIRTPEGGKEYAAVPTQTAYELFWEPAWRQRPEDYTGCFFYTHDVNGGAVLVESGDECSPALHAQRGY